MSLPQYTILCLASYFKGNRFLEELKKHGHRVLLLTVEEKLQEAWAREFLDEIFAVKTFADRRALINSVAYLMRSRQIDRFVALDDFDIEVAAMLREHFRMTDTGHGVSRAAFFRDKLAMRQRAAELGIPIPAFTPLFHHADVAKFLNEIPPPWLMKPRGEASAAGIKKMYHAEDVWTRLQELGDEQSFHLLEQMVPGDLFHVDSLVRKGEVLFAEVNAYRKPLLDIYQGGGIYATRTWPRAHPLTPSLLHWNQQVLTGFELGTGASHTEFMVSQGQVYFIETSARVGGANTAELVEHSRGVNLWAEWAQLEVARDGRDYHLPINQTERYAGVVISLADSETPDTSSFQDPEIVHRLAMKYHIGFVVASDRLERVEQLLDDYMERIIREHHAVLPAADKLSY